MSPEWIIPLAIVVIFVGVPLLMYNGLVRMRNYCRESWSDVDTELKRRHDLIPNLVEAVKGYAQHEREVFQQVASLRQQLLTASTSRRDLADRENALVAALSRVFAVAENYPQLKADQNFRQLMHELVITEDRIQAARRFYNANVRDYNTRCQTIPSSLIAKAAGFEEEEFFEIEDARERLAPVFSFDGISVHPKTLE